MKKTLIALATLGVVGAASAQVSVTGGVAVGLQTSVAGNGSNNAKAHFHLTNADINFAAKEDLGGGLSIAAGLGFSNEGTRAGAMAIENTTLVISGGFGSLAYKNVLSPRAKMGSASLETDLTDYLGGYANATVFEYTAPAIGGWTPFVNWSAVAAATATTGDLNASGSPTVGVTGSLGGANIYLENNTANAADGWDLRVTYDAGGAMLAVRTTKDKYSEFGVSMPLGAMTVALNSASQKNGATDNKGTSLGISYAMSKQTALTFGYGTGKGTVSGSNYRLNLSKSF
jgi:YD repeat-containing protein